MVRAGGTHEIEVYALSSPEGSLTDPVDNIEHMIVMKAGGVGVDDAVQPTKKTPVELLAQNSFGVKRVTRSLIATFPPSALAAGNEIRIVYDHGGTTEEKVIKLGAAVLAEIR